LLFDLLLECDALRNAALLNRIGFGINHVLVGTINKTLDLVLTRLPASRKPASRRTFSDLANDYMIELNSTERAALDSLPTLEQDLKDDINEVALA
jgi:hypothetical protein